jgi:hypothetical protein
LVLRVSEPILEAAEVIGRADEHARLRDQYIEQNPTVMGGEPVIRGTRVPVRTVAGLIEQGKSRKGHAGGLSAHPRGRVSDRGPLGARECAPRAPRTSLVPRRTRIGLLPRSVKLWIDECLSPTLVGAARRRGYEATCNRNRDRGLSVQRTRSSALSRTATS